MSAEVGAKRSTIRVLHHEALSAEPIDLAHLREVARGRTSRDHAVRTRLIRDGSTHRVSRVREGDRGGVRGEWPRPPGELVRCLGVLVALPGPRTGGAKSGDRFFNVIRRERANGKVGIGTLWLRWTPGQARQDKPSWANVPYKPDFSELC